MARPESRAVLILLIGLVAFGPLSTDLYLPALPGIVVALDSTPEEVQLTLSVFLAGFASAMLLYGPLSDRFGRRPVLVGAILLFLLASIACALAPSIETLIAARFVQALGACSGPVIGRAIVRDVYGRSRAAQVLSYVAMAMALAPAIGPILGGYVTVLLGWRANFLVLALFALLCLLAVLALLPETNQQRDPQATRPQRLVGNYRQLLSDRLYLGYVLVCSGAYAGIFAFISGSSFALIDGLGLGPDAYGLCFAAAVAGYMVGSFSSARLHGRISLQGLIAGGLAIALLGGLSGMALAFAKVWTVASIVGPASLYFMGAGLIMPNAMAGAIGPHPRMAGTASALLGFIQMSAAAILGVVIGHLQDGSPRAMATAIAATAIAAILAQHLLVRRSEAAAS